MILVPTTGRPIGQSVGRSIGRSAVSYDPDAAIFFNRCPRMPSALRRQLTNDLVVELKDVGGWDPRDCIHLTAFGLDDPGYTTVDDPQAMRLNLRQALYDLTAFSSPTPTTDRGYQGDNAAAYLGTNFNPTTAVGAKFTRNNANFAIWSLTAGTGAVSDAGYYGGANGVTVQCRDGSNNFTGRINQANVASSSGNTDGRGLYEVDRNAASGAGAIVSRKNGAAVVTNTTSEASTALLNAALQYLRYGTGSYSGRLIALGLIGGSVTPLVAANSYNAFLTYMQAVGAVA